MTRILKCKCENKYQDEKYGPSMRVHNGMGKYEKVSDRKWRCTVCEDIKIGK